MQLNSNRFQHTWQNNMQKSASVNCFVGTLAKFLYTHIHKLDTYIVIQRKGDICGRHHQLPTMFYIYKFKLLELKQTRTNNLSVKSFN